VFKTITEDNGSEFAGLSGELKIRFTHPYSSCKKGTNERHNRLLRRFIPKGKSISDYSADAICSFADCINGLSRKLLGYCTPDKLFDEQPNASTQLDWAPPLALSASGSPSVIPSHHSPTASILNLLLF